MNYPSCPGQNDMTDSAIPHGAVRIEIDQQQPFWERFFTVAPLVVIGTRDEQGKQDLAPKHMVTPLGWREYFGFVCVPRHRTWQNVVATRQFTVSYPRPEQVLSASLSATPRCDDDTKPVLRALITCDGPASGVPMLADSALWFECSLERIVEGFGENGLICGRIEHAYVAEDALRQSEVADEAVLEAAPLLAYVHPGRFATIDQALSFPLPAGMKK